MRDKKPAIVLLSGGLDSATTLALANEHHTCHAMTFAYGQRQQAELDAAARVAQALGCAEHRVVNIDLGAFGGSALTVDSLAVPKDRHESAMGSDIPITYVPARNTVFLALALAWAEVLGAFDIFIGANVVDYSGYPDCRPAFLDAFARLANLATAAGVDGRGEFRVHAPLLRWNKAEIIRCGMAHGVDYGLTHSCYDPEGMLACAHCDACLLRQRGFAEAGFADPTAYVPQSAVG